MASVTISDIIAGAAFLFSFATFIHAKIFETRMLKKADYKDDVCVQLESLRTEIEKLADSFHSASAELIRNNSTIDLKRIRLEFISLQRQINRRINDVSRTLTNKNTSIWFSIGEAELDHCSTAVDALLDDITNAEKCEKCSSIAAALEVISKDMKRVMLEQAP